MALAFGTVQSVLSSAFAKTSKVKLEQVEDGAAAPPGPGLAALTPQRKRVRKSNPGPKSVPSGSAAETAVVTGGSTEETDAPALTGGSPAEPEVATPQPKEKSTPKVTPGPKEKSELEVVGMEEEPEAGAKELKESKEPEGGVVQEEPQPTCGKAAEPLTAKQLTRSGFYQMDAEDRALVLNARMPKDIPLKVRNKIYSAIGRALDRPKISSAMAVAWRSAETAEQPREAKFEFLRKFAQDTEGAEMNIWEMGERTQRSYEDDRYIWITKTELYVKMNAFKYKEVAIYCDKQLAGAPTRPHTEKRHRRDPDFRQYKILKESIDGDWKDTSHKSGYELEGGVDPSATTEAVLACEQAMGPKRKRDDDVLEKELPIAKTSKLPLHEQRMKKMAHDIAAGKAAIEALISKDVPYRQAIVENIEKSMQRLRDVSPQMHEQSMEGAPEAAIDALWHPVPFWCEELKKDIDLAHERANTRQKPHTTPFDGVCKSQS